MKKQTKISPKNTHLWIDKTPENAPVVAVLWVDIVDISNYNEDHDVVAPVNGLYQIGHLLYQGAYPGHKGSMTVVATAYDYEQHRWANYTVFPTQVVNKMQYLTKPRKSRTK